MYDNDNRTKSENSNNFREKRAHYIVTAAALCYYIIVVVIIVVIVIIIITTLYTEFCSGFSCVQTFSVGLRNAHYNHRALLCISITGLCLFFCDNIALGTSQKFLFSFKHTHTHAHT